MPHLLRPRERLEERLKLSDEQLRSAMHEVQATAEAGSHQMQYWNAQDLNQDERGWYWTPMKCTHCGGLLLYHFANYTAGGEKVRQGARLAYEPRLLKPCATGLTRANQLSLFGQATAGR